MRIDPKAQAEAHRRGVSLTAVILRRTAAQMAGEECPECDSRVTESNNSTEYRCCACDHRWGYDNGEQYGF